MQVAAPSQVAQVPVLDAEAVQAFCGRWAKVRRLAGSTVLLPAAAPCSKPVCAMQLCAVQTLHSPPTQLCPFGTMGHLPHMPGLTAEPCVCPLARVCVCVQVGARSDPMDKFCELFGVPKWLRQATRLMTGMHIYIVDDTLVVKQVRADGACRMPSHTWVACALRAASRPQRPAVTARQPCDAAKLAWQ